MVRRRNPRGEGGRLRDEIVAAARAILDETGSEDAVTLRAIARRLGITAPSIYGHFDERGQIMLAVLDVVFAELTAHLRAAAAAAPDRTRLAAVCRAYVEFAGRRPNEFAVLFGRTRSAPDDAMTSRRDPTALVGAEAFAVLADAVASAVADDEHDVIASAAALWAAIHGFVVLSTTVPAFAWPPDEDMVDLLTQRLVTTPRRAHPGRSGGGAEAVDSS